MPFPLAAVVERAHVAGQVGRRHGGRRAAHEPCLDEAVLLHAARSRSPGRVPRRGSTPGGRRRRGPGVEPGDRPATSTSQPAGGRLGAAAARDGSRATLNDVMADKYTHRPCRGRDAAVKFGLDDARRRTRHEDLETEQSGISFHRVKPGMRQGFGQKHDEVEEVYVVVGGSARVKLDDDVLTWSDSTLSRLRGRDARLRGRRRGHQLVRSAEGRADDRGEVIQDCGATVVWLTAEAVVSLTEYYTATSSMASSPTRTTARLALHTRPEADGC